MSVFFEMIVRDRFDLSDGRTVFVGEMLGHDGDIKESVCNVFIRGYETEKINIYPEFPSRTKNGLRAISTLNNINSEDVDFASGEMVLKCHF